MDETAGAQIGRHVHPGIHDKAAACECPIERDLAAVASQAGSGPHLNRLPAGIHQAPVRSDSPIVYALMPLEICRRHRCTAAFEIFRCPDHYPIVFYKLAEDESRVLRGTDPNDDIYSLVDQVRHSVGQHEVDRDLGIGENEVAAHWADICAAERHWRAHTQKPLRFHAAIRQYGLGFVDLSQDALGSFIKILSFFCQRQPPSAAGNQACFGATLQRCETLADDAERQVHLPCGSGPASGSANTDERSQFGDVVKHARLSTLSIRWRVSPSKPG